MTAPARRRFLLLHLSGLAPCHLLTRRHVHALQVEFRPSLDTDRRWNSVSGFISLHSAHLLVPGSEVVPVTALILEVAQISLSQQPGVPVIGQAPGHPVGSTCEAVFQS